MRLRLDAMMSEEELDSFLRSEIEAHRREKKREKKAKSA